MSGTCSRCGHNGPLQDPSQGFDVTSPFLEYARRNPKTFKAVLVRFADFTSLQGIPFINRAKRWYSRAAWAFFTLLALLATTLQLHYVCEKYLRREIVTVTNIKYAEIPFPSVTLCNLNVIRKSKVKEHTPELAKLLDILREVPDNSEIGVSVGQSTVIPKNNSEAKQSTPNLEINEGTSQALNGSDLLTTAATPPHIEPGINYPSARGKIPPGQRRTPPGQDRTPPGHDDTPPGHRDRPPGRKDKSPGHNKSPRGPLNFTHVPPEYEQPKPGQGNRPPGHDTYVPPDRDNTPPGGRGVPPRRSDTDPRQDSRGIVPGRSNRRPHRQTRDFIFSRKAQEELDDWYYARWNSGTPVSFAPTHEADSSPASLDFIFQQKFLEMIAQEPRQNIEMGSHQAEDFILQCSYNAQDCSHLNFSLRTTAEHGNCFTFNGFENEVRPLVARSSGSVFGLKLVLNIEVDEYIDSLTHGSGVLIDIRPFNTLPFSERSTMTIAPGREYFIGLQLVNISRLGYPFVPCDDDGVFTNLYNKTYTQQGCIAACADRHVCKTCGCIHPLYSDRYPPILKAGHHTCKTDSEMLCAYSGMKSVLSGDVSPSCNCQPACQETNYESLTFDRSWPGPALWTPLMASICERISENPECARRRRLRDVREQNYIMRENFLTVHIYFRDLNYISIEEIPEYEISQFISDVGGTAGLWLGASVLTVVEIFDLVFQMCLFRYRNRQPQSHGTKMKRHGTGLNEKGNGHLGKSSSLVINIDNNTQETSA